MKTEQNAHHRRWLQLVIIALLVGVVLLTIKNWRLFSTTLFHPSLKLSKEGDLKKMMGIKGDAPEKLKSYQSVQGVLNIQHWITPHGVGVYFVKIPTLPMVDIELAFDAGAARNQAKGGLAYLTNQLLAEGTAQISADEVATQFDNVGVQFSANSQRDMAIVQLRSLSDPALLIPAVQTLAEIVAKPSFPEIGFKREQQNALSTLKQQSQLPQYVASRAFFSMIYGNQPYANWVLGDEKSIQALTGEDIKKFYQQYYVANNVIVTIVGDLSAQDADAIAQKLTNDLPKGEKAPLLPRVQALTNKNIKKIDFHSAQTHILMGQPGLKQNDPDYYALMVGNHILGGNGSVTRVFDKIRNQNGLAYSAYSYFTPMREQGPFILGCQTRNDQAEKAQNMMEALLKDFVTEGPTQQELEQAKKNLLGGYTLQFDSNASICKEVAALGFYGFPLDHFNQYKSAVEKISVDDIKQAFQRRISSDKIAIVLVGGSPDFTTGAPLPKEVKPSSNHEGHGTVGGPQS